MRMYLCVYNYVNLCMRKVRLESETHYYDRTSKYVRLGQWFCISDRRCAFI